MPAVQVIVLSDIPSEQRKRLDELIREEVCKAAKRLGEEEKIPDYFKDFSIVTGKGHRSVGFSVEISMMLFPRDPVKQDVYEQALEEAAHRAGFDDVLPRVHSAEPEDWRGSMWNFK